MADPSSAATAIKRHHRGVFVATLLLCLSLPYYSCGQETAAVVDEAAAAAAAEAGDPIAADGIVGDVTDLGDVVGDAMADLTDLVEDLDLDGGAVDDVDGKASEEEPATDAAGEAVDPTVGAAATDGAEPDADADAGSTSADSEAQAENEAAAPVVQSGPYIDLLGDVLLSLEMVDESQAQVHQHYTNEALSGKKVVGLYFSADWCGPCRQFTPDLVNFYNKMNARRGKQDEFEIVWISRCRSVDDFGQYFTHMNWLALPPNEAMGQRGQYLGEKYKVKGIPSLVLLDEIGNVITLDGRNKIPMDKAGIGFPWRSPMSVIVSTLVPKSFRLLVKSQLAGILALVKGVISGKGSKLKEALAGGGGQR